MFLIAFIVLALIFEWIERKLIARIQWRVGPLLTGFKGVLQPFYDFAKLLLKEEVEIEGMNTYLADFSIILYVLSSVLGLLFIPLFVSTSLYSFNEDFIVVPLTFALSAVAQTLMGLSIQSSFTVVGTGRLVVQYAMYESLLLITLALPFMQCNTLSMSDIVKVQSRYPILLVQPLGFVVALIALLAKLEKPPFDLPHAKQEIAAGWMTEYCCRRLAFIQLGKDLEMVYGVALITTVFLGGGQGPMTYDFPWLYPIYFIVKMIIVLLLLVILQGMAVRVREVFMPQRLWERGIIMLVIQAFILFILKDVGLI
ncbi:MAG: complex I subunit 1 family protein [Ignisphaera sp.]